VICLPKNAAGKRWRNILTGAEVSLTGDALCADQAFGELPVAVLDSATV
jgi:hypothetical protein